jgi:hypothetical protein
MTRELGGISKAVAKAAITFPTPTNYGCVVQLEEKNLILFMFTTTRFTHLQTSPNLFQMFSDFFNR